MYLKSILNILILTFIIISRSFASDSIINYSSEIPYIGSQIYIYEDKLSELDINDIKAKSFILSTSKVPNFGISNSTFWIKIMIRNTSSTPNLILNISLPTLDEVTLYYPKYNGNYNNTAIGEKFPFYERKYHDPNYLFDLNIPSGKIKTFFLKIKSKEAIQLPIRLGTKTEAFNYLNIKNLLTGVYLGVMLIMIFYNLFVYFLVQDRSYIYYIAYIILILLTQTSLQGYPFQFLWPNSPQIAQYSLFILPSLVGIASIVFMNVFLKVKRNTPKLYRLSLILFIPYIISILFSFLSYFKASFILMEANAMLVSIFMFYTIFQIVRQGYQSAKYFLAAWSIFLIGVIIYILKDFEILPFNNFARYTMQVGSALETVLLSFALASRINFYKKEKEKSQLETLNLLKENHAIVKNQKKKLKEQVTARTLELELTLQHLKKTQLQLVEKEKMSSLGQLTAGIAHEINNPINFVSSNIPPLRRDLEDIALIMKKYDELDSVKNIPEKLKEIETLKQELEYDYLKTELKTIIDGIEDGAKRTAEIVSGLRNFSRLDEEEIKFVNINTGIESTILLIRNKLQGATIEKKLGNIPLCECNPSKLNQLIMNLIDNAIHAVHKKEEDNQKGKVTVLTRHNEKSIFLSVKDNGIGISEEVKGKLFEPFFTTKDVGEGTGLGLSIVKGIIDSHNGKITILSEINKGTEIIVELPIKNTNNGKN